MFRTIQNRTQFFSEINEFKASVGDLGKSIPESKDLWIKNPDLQAYLKGEPIFFIDNAITQDLEVISSQVQLEIFQHLLTKRKGYFINEFWKGNQLLVSNIIELPAVHLELLLSKVMASTSSGTSPMIKEFLTLVNDAQVIKNVISNISKKGVHTNYRKTQVEVLNKRLNAINLLDLHAYEFPQIHTDGGVYNETSMLPPCPEIVFDYNEELSSDVNSKHIKEFAFNRDLKRQPLTELEHNPKRQKTNVLSSTIPEVHPTRLREIPPPVMPATHCVKPVVIPPPEMLQAQVLTLEAISKTKNNTPYDDANPVQFMQDFDFEKEVNEIEQHYQSQNSSPTLFGYAYGSTYQSFAVNSDISSENLFDEDELMNRFLNLR